MREGRKFQVTACLLGLLAGLFLWQTHSRRAGPPPADNEPISDLLAARRDAPERPAVLPNDPAFDPVAPVFVFQPVPPGACYGPLGLWLDTADPPTTPLKPLPRMPRADEEAGPCGAEDPAPPVAQREADARAERLRAEWVRQRRQACMDVLVEYAVLEPLAVRLALEWRLREDWAVACGGGRESVGLVVMDRESGKKVLEAYYLLEDLLDSGR